MATHSSILAWRIPWTEDAGGLQSESRKSQTHDFATKSSRWGAHVCLWYGGRLK